MGETSKEVVDTEVYSHLLKYKSLYVHVIRYTVYCMDNTRLLPETE